MRFDTSFWRRIHRWISAPAALFLCFAAVTGVIAAVNEFFGSDEALREATRLLVSDVNTWSDSLEWSRPLALAFASAASVAPAAPVDRVMLQFKGQAPTVTIYTGRPGGGEDRKLVFNLRTGALIANERYEDKPFLTRLHSGEAFGDGGLIASMLWGAVLVALTISGFWIYAHMYVRMRMRGAQGLRRVFW